MPNCKSSSPIICDKHHIKELETLAEIARTLPSESQQEEVLLEVIDGLGKGRSVQRGTISFICVPVIAENSTIGTLSADCDAMDMDALDKRMRFPSIVATMVANDVGDQRTEDRNNSERMIYNHNLNPKKFTQYAIKPLN